VLCAEFHCPPTVAYREWIEAPDGLIEGILEARYYARAKAMVEAAGADLEAIQALPDTPLVRWAQQIEMDEVNRHRAR
jgi:hypothetical protein